MKKKQNPLPRSIVYVFIYKKAPANYTVGLKFNTSMAYGTAPNYVNNTFTDNGTAVCIDSLPGNEVIDFAGSVF